MSQIAVEPAELRVIAMQSNALAADLRQALGGPVAALLGSSAVAGAHAEFQATWRGNLEEIATKLDALGQQLTAAATAFDSSEQGITGAFASTSVSTTGAGAKA